MKTLKLFIFSLILILAFSTGVKAEFFSDVIVTSPNGIWTDSRAYSTLNAAITAVGANQRTIVIANAHTVTALTVPANVTLKFERDGSITNSGQLTINTKNIIADDHQIFTGTGDIDFAQGTIVKSSWFSSIDTALSLTNDDTVTLLITKQATVHTNQSVGNNVTLKWDSQLMLGAAAGITVSNIGQVEAGLYQIFSGAGNFRFRDGTILNLYWFNNLRAAITHASTNKLTLLVQGTHTVDLSDSIPSTLTTKMIQGGIFSISPGITLTMNGGIDAGDYQIFSGTGTVAGLTGINEVNAIWFGTSYTQATIESALTAIGTTDKATLLLRPGTWVISSNANWSAYTNVTFKIVPGAVFSGISTYTVKLPNQEVDVAWFGAKGDGSTDDKAAIKAAFAAVPSGGKIIVPKTASYYKYDNSGGLTDAVAITQSVMIQLDGTIKSTSSTNGANPPYIFNVTGTGFRMTGGGTLQGSGTFVVNEATYDNIPGLLKLAANDAIIDGITFLDGPETSIYIPNVDNITIRNCRITGGPLVADATSPQHYMIVAYGGKNHLISGNIFYASSSGGSTRNAIVYGSFVHAQNLTITDNQFVDIHEHATYLTEVSDSVISNNIVNYSQAAASQLGNAMKVGGQQNVISGNQIYNAVQGGITLYAANDCVIQGNVIKDFGHIGISITNNSADTIGFSRNIIDSNVLYARTDGETVYEGIAYSGAADTTANCYGGKITNNTIANAGTSTETRSAITVQHNISYSMVDFDISNNKIITPVRTGICLIRVTESKINHNTMLRPATACSRFIYSDYSTLLTIEGNIIRDDNTPSLVDYFINLASTNNNYFELLNNGIFTTANTALLGGSVTYNVRGRGNRLSETDRLTGTFTINGVATLKVDNDNIADNDLTNGQTHIVLTPLNAAAATIMGSAKALYVSARTVKQDFTVATADGNVVAVSDAIFSYEIIQ